jgi:probable HAF family extracellular repeat protein
MIRPRKLVPLVAGAVLVVLGATAGAAATGSSAQAASRYPYTLIDPGTFGGPSSFFDGPGVPLTNQGVLLGAADTATANSAYDSCPSNACDGYEQHAFTWRDGQLTDLGVVAGKNGSAIYELNDHGVGAGVSQNGLDPVSLITEGVAALFKGGQVVSLGTLPGGHLSFALDVNNPGQVAGLSSNGTPDPFSFFNWGTQTRGFAWRNGVMHDLGTLGGPDTVTNSQNQRGQITGWSYANNTPNPATGLPTTDPFLWTNGRMTGLGTLGGTFGMANWQNNAGQVVGQSDLAGDTTAHPFLWKNGHMIDLGTLGGGYGGANWINDRGDVAGFSTTADQAFHGFLWRHGTMTDLPPVGGAPFAFAGAVNNRGQVVGHADNAQFNDLIAVLWAGGRGYDLNTLVAPNPLQMVSADYINNQGDIVGHGVLPNGDQRMFLLIRNPSVPLPATPAPSRPLPATGPPDQSPAIILALHAVGHGGIKAGLRQLRLHSPL